MARRVTGHRLYELGNLASDLEIAGCYLLQLIGTAREPVTDRYGRVRAHEIDL